MPINFWIKTLLSPLPMKKGCKGCIYSIYGAASEFKGRMGKWKTLGNPAGNLQRGNCSTPMKIHANVKTAYWRLLLTTLK